MYIKKKKACIDKINKTLGILQHFINTLSLLKLPQKYQE